MNTLAISGSPRAADRQPGIRPWRHRRQIVEAASITIPLLDANISEAEMAETPAISHAIREALAALYGAVVLRQADGGPVFPV